MLGNFRYRDTGNPTRYSNADKGFLYFILIYGIIIGAVLFQHLS